MGKILLKEKSYNFAIQIIRSVQDLQQNKNEYILSKQLLRSGTAIGALLREAEYGESKKDFIHKMQIALKEANETIYWLSLLKDTAYMDELIFEKNYSENKEIIAMLVASIKTCKLNINSN